MKKTQVLDSSQFFAKATEPASVISLPVVKHFRGGFKLHYNFIEREEEEPGKAEDFRVVG